MDDLPAHLWWYVSTPCSFFRSGNCKHGNKCQYFHATSNGAVTIVDAVVYIESLDKDTERYQLQRFARSIGATTRCKLHNSGRYDGLQSAHIHFTSVFDANAFMEHMVSYQKRAECKLNQVTTYTYMPSSVQSHPAEQLPLSTFLPLPIDAPAVLCSDDVLSDASDSVVLESNDELPCNAIESIDAPNTNEDVTTYFTNLVVELEPPVFAEFPNPLLARMIDLDAMVVPRVMSASVSPCNIETVDLESTVNVQVHNAISLFNPKPIKRVTNWADMCEEEDEKIAFQTSNSAWNTLHISEEVSTLPSGSTENDFPTLLG